MINYISSIIKTIPFFSTPTAVPPAWEFALSSWVERASAMEWSARKSAERRIKECYAQRDRYELHLNGLGLTSIEGLIFPQDLQTLDLSNNKITAIEDVQFQGVEKLDLSHNWITSIDARANFQGIKILNVSDNRITSIVYANFQGLEILDFSLNQITSISGIHFQNHEMLDFAYNQLTSIEGSHFQGVKRLFLDHNRIASIAGAVFQEVGLLFLNYNPITHLPIHFANLAMASWIFTQHCRLTQRAVIEFQDAIDERAGDLRWNYTIYNPSLAETFSIEETLSQYLQIAPHIAHEVCKTFSFTETVACDLSSVFSNEEKELLNQFLQRLKTTADFNNTRTQGGVIFTVYQILKTACLFDKFKGNLFPLICDAFDSCEDRVSITLNRIELQRLLDTTEVDIDLLVGYRRLQLVHEAAKKIIRLKRLADEIEPTLYLQNQLKRRLKLPIATEGMLYPIAAQVTDDELERIANEIEEATSSFEQQLAILTEKLSPIEMRPEKLVNLGTLSKTNPFNFNIQELWESYLRQKNPTAYEELSEELENATPAEWSHAVKNLNIKLTRMLLAVGSALGPAQKKY